MEYVISITVVDNTTSSDTRGSYTNLDGLTSPFMPREDITELQILMQAVWNRSGNIEARQIVTFLISLSHESKSMMIKHHLYGFFRRLIYNSPIVQNLNLEVLWLTPEWNFDLLQGEIMKFASVIQSERHASR